MANLDKIIDRLERDLLTVREPEKLRSRWIGWFEEEWPDDVPRRKAALVGFIISNSDPILASGGLADFVEEMKRERILMGVVRS